MKKIAVHSLLLLIILGSGRLQAVAGPADKIRKNIECYFNDYLRVCRDTSDNRLRVFPRPCSPNNRA